MNKVIAVAATVLAVLALNVRADSSDMNNVLKALARANPVEHEAKMREFIEAAKSKDVEKMLEATSPVTRKRAGDDALRSLYTRDTIPLFQIFSQMSEGGTNEYAKDEAGNEGWVFKKTFTNAEGQTAPIYLAVLKEGGKLYVSSIGLWKN